MDDESKTTSTRSTPNQPVRNSGERGTTLVEYAMTLTLTLLLLFGIVDFGRALYSYHFISNAAREGTRYASVRGYECGITNTFPTACPASAADIQNYVKNVPQGIDPAQITVTSTWINPNNLAVCNTQDKYPGCAIRVRVRYNFKFLFPLMPANFRMSSTSYMVISH